MCLLARTGVQSFEIVRVQGIGAIYARGGTAVGGCHLAWPGGGGGGGLIALHMAASAVPAISMSAAGGDSG